MIAAEPYFGAVGRPRQAREVGPPRRKNSFATFQIHYHDRAVQVQMAVLGVLDAGLDLARSASFERKARQRSFIKGRFERVRAEHDCEFARLGDAEQRRSLQTQSTRVRPLRARGEIRPPDYRHNSRCIYAGPTISPDRQFLCQPTISLDSPTSREDNAATFASPKSRSYRSERTTP